MKKIFFSCAASLAMLAFSSCSDDINYETGDGEGRLLVTASLKSDVKTVSRAAVTDDALAAGTTIWISNSQGVVRKFNGIGEVPAEGVWLVSDNYVAQAWAGDSVSASFDKKCYKGIEPFTITKGSTVQVNIECKILNTVVEVSYPENMEEMLTDFTMTVGHTAKDGTLVFNGREDEGRPGYFMMPSFDKNLTCTLAGTAADGSAYTTTKVIENAKPATKYIVKVKAPEQGSTEFGGGLFTIEVDETEIVVEDVVEIVAAPVISALNFDLDQPIVGESGKLTEKKLWIQATSALKSVEITAPFLTEMGMDGNDFEIFGMHETVASQLAALGFRYQHVTHENDAENPEFEEMKLTLSDEFMNAIPKGDHTLTIKVTDAAGRTGMRQLSILLSDAKVRTNALAADAATTWATKATISGTVMQEGLTGLGFNYREKGAQQWTAVAVGESEANGVRRRASMRKAPAVGGSYSVVIEGLKPGTTYEYQAVCEGFEGGVETFTTEPATQLPNAGFEDWNTSSTPYLIGDRSFWDSGNHGSATLSQNVTVPDETIKHGGSRSIKLESKFPNVVGIGKFAAGNVFTGRYLDTNGTDGELGWGRPFTSRPKALKGYVKYTSVEVNCVGNKQNTPQGYQDKGIIYIAMLDGTTVDFTTSKSKERYTEFPVIVQTKEENLFKQDAANVIAFGKQVFDTTPGDGLIEFEIPLDYVRTDIKAAHIMVVASSSEQGDYFIGGKGSTMWLDDLELVY